MSLTTHQGSALRGKGVSIMAYDVSVKVHFRDAKGFVVTKDYMLVQTAATDGSDMGDVLDAATALITQLDLASMDHIDKYDVSVTVPQSGAAANVAANNGIEAFSRVVDNVTNKIRHFVVPAWDAVLYTANPNSSMGTAYDVVAGAIAALIRNPENGNAWTFKDSQNRAVKRGQRQFKP